MTSPLTHDDPERLGPYRLVARLGSGGMGTVYVARSDRGRTVALKTMHAEFAAQADYRTRFRLETDAARVIGGRHGAEVVGADPLAETPWLATEYVLGPPLDDVVAMCGPLPEEATRALGAALCDALAQLHRSEVVHRDLKPSNILITATGPKLIDFGIARAAGDERLTRTGAAAGTPAFMSPEQATGMEHAPAGDVFALAGVLVFASTGHGPFGVGQAADLLYRVRYSEADLAAVPPGLRPLLERCLTKDAHNRPGTAELAEALRTGCGSFEEDLPDAVHAEILRRAAAVWSTEYARTPAPEADTVFGEASLTRTPLSRRRALAMGGSGVVAAGAAAVGAWAWLAPDEEKRGDDGSTPGRRPPGVAPEALWKDSSAESLSVTQALFVGKHVALLSDSGLSTLDVESGDRLGKNDSLIGIEDLAVSDDAMYAVDPQSLELCPVDLDTGTLLGSSFKLSKLGLKSYSLLGAHLGLVLIAGEDEKKRKGKKRGSVRIAIDGKTGEERWRRAARTPLEDQDTVLMPVGDVFVIRFRDELTGLSRRTGKVLWSRRFPGELMTATSWNGGFARSRSHLYLGIGYKELAAIRVSDGRISWRFGADRKFPEKTAPDSLRYGKPTVRDGVLYAQELGNGVIALDAGTGKLKWELKADWAAVPANGTSPPVVGNRYLYFPTPKTQWVTAVDLKSRKEAWTFQGPNDSGGGVLLAHRKSRRLIATSGGTTLALPLE
ncbi:serine/threonine-protein kinase [Streptomyces albidus (ex Kaewkla and Franco 2022)]|uniref:serine/threonine-protein kinase n=1 Tax=Streptomyces albidus (ex Kaewkla and Franco 2022) TaxID=722709 RepID=UPI0015EFABF5|nr:serine/threonine-protein kinase [Streptomyces albidus (ex Kaewkla and Franco 2022)]